MFVCQTNGVNTSKGRRCALACGGIYLFMHLYCRFVVQHPVPHCAVKLLKCESSPELGAVHILRQPPEGGEGVWQMLTIADEGG